LFYELISLNLNYYVLLAILKSSGEMLTSALKTLVKKLKVETLS